MPAGAYIHIFTYALAYETTKCNKQETNATTITKYFSRQATAWVLYLSLSGGVLFAQLVLHCVERR